MSFQQFLSFCAAIVLALLCLFALFAQAHSHNEQIHSHHACNHGHPLLKQPIVQQTLWGAAGNITNTNNNNNGPSRRSMSASADTFRNIKIRMNTTFIEDATKDISKRLGGQKSCTFAGQKLIISESTSNENSVTEACLGENDKVVNVDNCYVVCRDRDVVDQYAELFANNMRKIETFFESWVQVQQFPDHPNIFTDNDCGDLPLTNETVSDDIVIYLTMRAMPYLPTTLAFANPCFLHPISSRPVAMHVNVQPITFEQNSDITTVLRHEVLHGFGFSSDMYRFYRHPNDRTKTYFEYDSTTFKNGPLKASHQASVEMNDINGRHGPQVIVPELGPGRSLKIITPNVVAFGRSYFGCPTLDGVELENDGTSASAGTHWESRILYWELMTAVQKSISGKLTGFTAALVKDMGFYNVADSYKADEMDFGYHKGCGFADDLCNTKKYVNGRDVSSWYFCEDADQEYCGYNYQFLGRCNLVLYNNSGTAAVPQPYQYFANNPFMAGRDEFVNRCPMTEAYNDGFCTSRFTGPTDAVNVFFETNGSSTRCHHSRVINKNYNYGSRVARCFKTVCVGTNSSMVRLGEYMFPCEMTANKGAMTFLGPAATDKTAPTTTAYIRSNSAIGLFTCSNPSDICDDGIRGINSDMLRVSAWPTIRYLAPSANISLGGDDTVYIFGANMNDCTGVRVGEAVGKGFQVHNSSCASFTTPTFAAGEGGAEKSGAGTVQLQLRCIVAGCNDTASKAKGGCYVSFTEVTLQTEAAVASAAEELSEFFGTTPGFIVLAVIGLLVVVVMVVIGKSLFCSAPQRFDAEEDVYNIEGGGRLKPLKEEMTEL